ncbi:hypothetical protein D3C84_718010 [compost metagenome]
MTAAERPADVTLPCRLGIDKEVLFSLTLGQLLELLLAGVGRVAGVNVGVVGIGQSRVLRSKLGVGLPQIRVTHGRAVDDLGQHGHGDHAHMLRHVLVDLVGEVAKTMAPSGFGVHYVFLSWIS